MFATHRLPAALAFTLLALAPAGPLPAQAGAPPIPANPALTSLDSARVGLEQAAKTLSSASTGNHGGYVEKARADVGRALTDVRAATLAFVQADPGAAASPATTPPGLTEIYSRLAHTRPGGGSAQSSMYGALPPLRTALDALQSAPGGTLGGNRDAIAADIGQAAADIIAGIQFLDSHSSNPAIATVAARAVSTGPAPAPPEIAAAPREPETARQRLLQLQASLRAAIAALKQMPSGGFADRALLAARDTLADTGGALDYLAAHPEAELPPADTVTVALPGLLSPGTLIIIRRNTGPGYVAEAYHTLPAAYDSLLFGLRDFLNGTPAPSAAQMNARGGGGGGGGGFGTQTMGNLASPTYNPIGPGPVIGPLGGFRDKILRHAGTALVTLATGVYDLAFYDPATDAPKPGDSEGEATAEVPANATGQGALSGRVLDTAGDPVANVLINLSRVHKLGYNGPSSDVPMTLTDADGAFTVPDLPPGSYRVTARLVVGLRTSRSITASAQPVEVKPASATKLNDPLQLR